MPQARLKQSTMTLTAFCICRTRASTVYVPFLQEVIFFIMLTVHFALMTHIQEQKKQGAFLCLMQLPYETVSNKALAFHTSFPEFHSDFPSIFDENGAGWYYRYLHSLSNYIKKDKDNVTKKLHCFAEKKTVKAVESTCANKLIQFQYSIYNDRSSADFPLSF